ncbi:hypothetical protein M408DRAFT_104645 [Serendipita vermifera MAFF 305830]|uniref:Uncharacterized protein n=1 Tax=Serendipita vermifera MAFF 305830 TaxID=933852 RepID=A0A0C3AQ72_SERVB|nr:hypothetical protein M408DRAFT_104645 [Serendipita vermifera MAFF 305830]
MFASLAMACGSFVSAGVDSRGEVLVPSLASPPIPNLVWDPLDRRWADKCPVWACWHADQAGSDPFFGTGREFGRIRHAARYPCWPHGVLAVGRDRRVGAETFLVGSLGRRLVRTRRSRARETSG